jgi:hypothetical protein
LNCVVAQRVVEVVERPAHAAVGGAVESTAGLYGKLQGIAGRSLQEIAGLEVPLLDGPPASEAAE